MTGVAAVSTSPAVAAAARATSAQGGLPLGVRLPTSRIDFRSLLREDTLAREPTPTLAMMSLGSTAAASPRPFPSGATSPGGLPKGEGDDFARLAVARDDDPLDPLLRHHASLGAPETLFSPSTPTLAPQTPLSLSPTAAAEVPTARAASSLEELFPQLVRRVAWSGDGRRGSMRLEIGAGALAGSTLLVHADGGRVRVQLDVPPGVDATGWQERIRQRLDARGIPTDSVEVT